jgi:hypothetical protein
MLLVNDKDRGIYKWVPFEVHYGIPLYNIEVNRVACEKIEIHKLFGKKNLEKFSRESRELSLRVLDFVADLQAGSSFAAEPTGVVPLPGQVISWPPPLALSKMQTRSSFM